MKTLAFATTLLLLATTAHAQIGRPLTSPLHGVTFDDVSNVDAEVLALSKLARWPMVRVVFDKGVPVSYYRAPVAKFRYHAFVMGQLADSSYMKAYTLSSITAMANSYVTSFGPFGVDLWEIGNEINGNWLGTNAFGKMAAMYDAVASRGGRTALTFFYEGETNEPNNCIDSQGGMFPWITRYFINNRTAESEKIRLGLNYVLISWYPDQCQGEKPNWAWVYTKLASIFPNSKVGFGEIGTANPENGSAYEKNEIMTYYPMAKTTPGLPSSYIGGYFWWYAAEEIVPWPGSLGNTINAAMSLAP